jgi:hypothetical protein
MSELTRESYIERELERWKENYIIPIEQEFSVRAMLGLQFQYDNTVDEHVRTKKDLIDTIQRILGSLRLKPVLSKDRFRVLVIVNNNHQTINVYNMFQKMLFEKISFENIKHASNGDMSVKNISTKHFDIRIEKANINLVRGLKADYILNLSGDKEIDDYFKNHNKL